jgi:hypothetical protein
MRRSRAGSCGATTRLRRLANVRDNPRVALLADGHDDEDRTGLWWGARRRDGNRARPGTPRWEVAADAQLGRYAQYRAYRPAGEVVWCSVERWMSWSAT